MKDRKHLFIIKAIAIIFVGNGVSLALAFSAYAYHCISGIQSMGSMEDLMQRRFLYFLYLPLMALAIGAVVSGIHLWRLRSWARNATEAISWSCLILATIATVHQILTLPQFLDKHQIWERVVETLGESMACLYICAIVPVSGGALCMPIIITILFLRRSSTRKLFERKAKTAERKRIGPPI